MPLHEHYATTKIHYAPRMSLFELLKATTVWVRRFNTWDPTCDALVRSTWGVDAELWVVCAY